MGCGLSLNDTEVKSPHQQNQPKINIIVQSQDTNIPETNEKKNLDLKQIKTQKSIIPPETSKAVKATTNTLAQEQPAQKKQTNARIYLFGECKDSRKIVQFQALPTPHIQILLSRTHSLPPVKYQPSQVILQESQQLMSSNLYISTSHPPYNYMFATFIKYNTIFLCGGVTINFDNVSSQAFLFNSKDQQSITNSPQKNQKSYHTTSVKNKRRVGNNLMGSKFQRLAMMRTKRYSHMGVFYKAGKLSYVYIFGGRAQNDQTLSSCEKYCIQQNKWLQIAPMSAPRSTGFSIIVNKKIYVFGGYTGQGKRSKKIQRYTPNDNRWDILNVKLHKGIETGIILPCPASNQILIVGGHVQSGALKSVIRVNFQNQTYWWDSDLKKERLLQKGISILQENTAYVLGGDFQDTIQKYSYKDKTWKLVTNINYSQCVSPDQINAFTLAQETVELNFQTDVNNHATNKSTKQNESFAPKQYKYIFGTDDYPCIYQINTSKWVLKKKNVPMSLRLRCHMTATKIMEGKLFIAGGIDCYYQKPSKAAYIYYTGTNNAIQISKMKQKKYAFAACSYNNFVYIFGGQDGKEGKVLTAAEKYDITNDKWIELPQMPRQRTFLKTVLTPNNKILLFGGTDSLYQGVSQIDIFDPQTDTFSTFNANFPLSCEIKFLSFTGNVVKKKYTKPNSQQFQFLDDLSSKQNSQIKLQENEDTLKVQSVVKQNINQPKLQNISNVKLQDISEYYMIVFGYNSNKKQDDAYILSLGLDQRHTINFDQRTYKLYPYSLTFEIKPQAGLKQKKSEEKIDQIYKEKIQSIQIKQQQTNYYFISNKGVFKWQQSTKQMSSQIVINQMHMLQMPLEKFSIV